VIRSAIDYLRFERAEQTSAVAELLAGIARALATDRPDAGGARFMLWREEQAAIGELTRAPGSVTGYVSFAAVRTVAGVVRR
jgi:hypothetical protein